ncbi:type III toxin-antitoxin system ToxN/AbiQ family toxin [Erysipelotrichaceae bacterium 51-3]
MDTELCLYKVDADYLKYLHKFDYRISVKYNNRPFVGIITMVNGIEYVLPLTSQTTEERKREGGNKRSPVITTFIKDSSNKEIANILHNNMFPVKNDVYVALDVDATKAIVSISIFILTAIKLLEKRKHSIINCILLTRRSATMKR